MNLNFEISLEDIGIGLELSGNSESERQEVMDFLVHVDESVADYEFSQELIIRLATSFAEDGGEKFAYQKAVVQHGTQYVKLPMPSLAESLSHLDEDQLIVLLANAVFMKREREEEA